MRLHSVRLVVCLGSGHAQRTLLIRAGTKGQDIEKARGEADRAVLQGIHCGFLQAISYGFPQA